MPAAIFSFERGIATNSRHGMTVEGHECGQEGTLWQRSAEQAWDVRPYHIEAVVHEW